MPRAGLPGVAKSGTGVLATTRLSPWSVEEGSDVEKSENRIVVLVIEDEALILDLMEEVLAGLDVPRKIRRGGFRNVHRPSAFNI